MTDGGEDPAASTAAGDDRGDPAGQRVTPAQERIRVAEERAADAERRADAALASALEWRRRAVETWTSTVADRTLGTQGESELLRADHRAARELEAIKRTLSWRMTRPVRTVRRAVIALVRQ